MSGGKCEGVRDITNNFYSVGVDSGRNGGICILSPSREIVAVTSMPETELGIWMWMNNTLTKTRLHGEGRDTKFKSVIEKVGGYIGRKSISGGDRGSHMFVFGRTYGALCMSLMALDLYPFREIVPRVWQKALGISPREKDETDTSFKNRLKDRAKELYPNTKVTLPKADAILIAHYASL